MYWIEGPPGSRAAGDRSLSAPIDVGPALKQQLYDKVPSVVLTSATLSAGGAEGVRHFQKRLALDDADTKQLGSPFDFKKQVELHVFRDMPDPSSRSGDYEEAVLDKIPEYVGGRRGGRSCCSRATRS